MKKLVAVALCAIFTLSGSMLMAQRPQGGQRGGQREAVSIEKRVEKMQEVLKLSDEQCEQIVAIEKDREKQRKEGQKSNRNAIQEQMKAHQEKMQEVLTDEQYASWKKMAQRQQQNQRQGQRPSRRK